MLCKMIDLPKKCKFPMLRKKIVLIYILSSGGQAEKSPSANWVQFIIRRRFSHFVAKCEVIKGARAWRGGRGRRKDL